MAIRKDKRTWIKLEELIERNTDLMREFKITAPEELIDALGDRYYNQEIRKALMDQFPAEERTVLRDFYYRNINAGIDRCPACIRVTMNWERGSAWTPKDQDYLVTMRAVFDRIKLKAKYKCRTARGLISITLPIDEEFAEEFFAVAETLWWQDSDTPKGSCAFDVDLFSFESKFGNRDTRNSGQVFPDSHYYKLYQDARDLLSKSLNDITKRL